MRRRYGGVFGLAGSLVDEATWFVDQRSPQPIEANLRSAVGSPLLGPAAPAAVLNSARGVAGAVLDDEVDSTEHRRRRPRRRRHTIDGARPALDELVEELRALVERLDGIGRVR